MPNPIEEAALLEAEAQAKLREERARHLLEREELAAAKLLNAERIRDQAKESERLKAQALEQPAAQVNITGGDGELD